MTHQPAISFSNSFHFLFNRAGGRTSNVREDEELLIHARYDFRVSEDSEAEV